MSGGYKSFLAVIFCLAMGGIARGQALNADTDQPLIPNGPNFVVSSAVDQRGNVWLGTEDQGVWRAGPDGTQQFGKGDGLADQTCYAMACDTVGRVWAGENNHGVAVFDGKSWKNYDATRGPGGSHVTAIAVCPVDGDVWIATENGLTRYSQKKDTWTDYDRSTGMPDIEISSLAFDTAGNLYVGLQCGGIAMAGPGDEYKTWRVVTGPDEMPLANKGDGLSSPLVNAIAVDPNGRIYAGTCNGLAYSSDRGQTWKFVRGKDWLNLARGSYDGAPQNLTAGRTVIPEDWVTSLCPAPGGLVYVGFRSKGYEALSVPAMTSAGATPLILTRTLCVTPEGDLIVGTYGRGALRSAMASPGGQAPAAAAGNQPAFPTPVAAPTAEELDAMIQQVQALSGDAPAVEVLPDDWSTRGDWVGRYGGRFAFFGGFGTANGKPSDFTVSVTNGPYRLREYVADWQQGVGGRNNMASVLFQPETGGRAYGEVNDEATNMGAEMTMMMEGPDLFVRLGVPAGTHRVSLYFYNIDGHSGRNAYNDYVLYVKCPQNVSGPATEPVKTPLVDDEGMDRNGVQQSRGSMSIDAELAPSLARLRVPNSWEGAYKRMLLRGPATYWIKIARNHTNTTKFAALFADAIGPGPATVEAGRLHLPAPTPATDLTTIQGAAGDAARLWAALDGAADKAGYADCEARMRLAAYRAALAAGADENLLANWRWRMPLWTDADHAKMDAMFKNGVGN